MIPALVQTRYGIVGSCREENGDNPNEHAFSSLFSSALVDQL